MSKPLVTSLAGVTIACPQPQKLVDLIVDGLGWDIINQDAVDVSLEKSWGIASNSAGKAFAILCSPGSGRGMIRVVEGSDRVRSRPMGSRWTGVEIVVENDLDDVFRRLDAHAAFATIKAPARADFTDVGSNIHRFFFGRAPGGTHLMFTMGVTAPQDYDFPSSSAQVGYIFDVPLVTAQFARAQNFYRHTLGMVPILEDRLTEGVWHEAWDLPVGAVVDLEILKGDAPDFGLGGIELQGYASSFIDPTPLVPDRLDGGACMATFTANDLDATFAAVSASDAARILSPPTPLSVPPYDGSRAFCFLGPSGERMEVCETDWSRR